MQLTRQLFDLMKEVPLQNDVLIPLFRAMGFRDVKHNDGGPNELGKDLVMWREEELRERVNYAIVLKAEKITGQASLTNNSASTVLFQVTQAFNESYPDSNTGEEQTIHRCWVISSKEVSKEAINAIKGTLRKNNLDKITNFIDGDTLWNLIEKYLPEKGVLAEIQSAKVKLETLLEEAGLAEHFRIIANTEGEFVLKAKHPDALKAHPLIFPLQFKFDTTDPDGKQALDEFKRLLSTGAPLKLTDPYVTHLQMPDFMERLFGFTPQKIEVSIGHVPMIKHAVKLRIEGDDGGCAQVDYIILEDIQRGPEEITFSNEAQESGWKLKVVMDCVNNNSSFTLNFNPAGLNVFEALNGFRFQEGMSKGGMFTIESLSNGFQLANQQVPTGTHPVPESKWVELIEAMLFIQQKTFCLLKCPENVTDEDAQTVFAVRDILRNGRAQVMPAQWETKPLSREETEKLLENFGNHTVEEAVVAYKSNYIVSVFMTDVPLGPVVYTCPSAHLTKEHATALRASLETREGDQGFIASITPVDDKPFNATYLEWLPIKEKAAALRSPIFRVGALQNGARLLWESTKHGAEIDVAAFVNALAEVCAHIPNEGESDVSILNPFSNSTAEELRIALTPIVDELSLDAKQELGERLAKANLLSHDQVLQFIGASAEDSNSVKDGKAKSAGTNLSGGQNE